MAEEEKKEEGVQRFDWYRYAARSFILPLIGSIVIAVWAFYYPDKWALEVGGMRFEGLVIPLLGILFCIGVFNMSDALKSFAGK